MPIVQYRWPRARAWSAWCLSLICAASLLGCAPSGAPGGSAVGTAARTVASGVFIDAPVQGLQYQSGDVSGITGADGKFQYIEGRPVRFFIGGVTIGQAPGAALITPLQLTNTNDPAAFGAINRTRFLIALDDDGNPDNGIQISANERAVAPSQRVNFNEAVGAFGNDGAVQSLVAQITAATAAGARGLVSPSTAQAHLAVSMGRYYAGSYTGEFTGIADSGSFTLDAAADGTVSGTLQSDQRGAQSLSGQFSPGGVISFQSGGTGGTAFNGTLTAARALSGIWSDAATGTSGTFSGGFDKPVATSGAYTVGGTVQGLNGSLVLQDNGVDVLAVHQDGDFTFPTPLPDGSPYSVTVSQQPAGQVCTVAQAGGTVSGANVGGVAVTCAAAAPATYTVGGTVSGLSGSLQLRINGGERVTVTRDGAFSFPTPLNDGSAYAVDVAAQPGGQTCAVAGGAGVVQGADVQSVTVSCSDTAPPPTSNWHVGGQVSGLSGTVVLQNNGGDDILLHQDGTFTFPAALPDGSRYAVAVATQPAGQSCSVANGSGTIAGADVTAVAVTCRTAPPPTPTYHIGGSVSGLAGTLVLQNGGGERVTVTQDGPFTFPTPLADGSAYAVSVATAPAGQTCAVAGGSGTVQGADVTSIAVTCRAVVVPTYTVGGRVSGLAGTLVLQLDGAEQLSLTADGSFAFQTALQDGNGYDVAVASQPAGQNCGVAGGSGTVQGADVTTVTVTCSTTAPPPTYTVGGVAQGLSGTVVLHDNGGDPLAVTQDGAFTFRGTLRDGAAFNVTVAAQPSGQQCTVSGGSGTVQGADVTSVTVTCQDVAPAQYHLGGSVTGLAGLLVLQSNGQTLFVGSDGPFIFAAPLDDGTAYDVGVAQQPAGQTCTVQNGSGTISGADVSSVAVDCAYTGGVPTPRTIGGTATGLNGGTLTLGDGIETLAVFGDGAFTFNTPVLDGTSYSVTVIQAPPGLTCTVANGSGTVSGADVSVTVTCSPVAPQLYSVGGTVHGLHGQLLLQDNGSDTLALDRDGSFTFATGLATGTAYQVTVASQPDHEVCVVGNDQGVVGAADVTSVQVDCGRGGGGHH